MDLPAATRSCVNRQRIRRWTSRPIGRCRESLDWIAPSSSFTAGSSVPVRSEAGLAILISGRCSAPECIIDSIAGERQTSTYSEHGLLAGVHLSYSDAVNAFIASNNRMKPLRPRILHRQSMGGVIWIRLSRGILWFHGQVAGFKKPDGRVDRTEKPTRS
jgi:hypothetical protein